ncbi:exonuclease [Shimia sagamensis]|uniref:Exonuclease n=1 Tax=Shimia sagamensis TaxID=1566352 RepID=A0ABY1NA37_9RHOB|nr:exonuclease [Shimia sagamensis]SMP04485.1 hypothetical protein SAMN06265373_101453 [Shimia sagamensis]
MSKIVIFDTEYMSRDGAMYRVWSAANDPDPILVQIGAVLVDLQRPARVVNTLNVIVTPQDRHGRVCKLDPYFVQLTGLTDHRLDTEGVSLRDALMMLDSFSLGSDFWSWGKDELFALGISCFVQGVCPPIPAQRFFNLKSVMSSAISERDIANVNSAGLSQFFGLSRPTLRAHDALGDATSLSDALLHLLDANKIDRECFFRARE